MREIQETTFVGREKDGRGSGQKQFVRYELLLAKAHGEGLRSIATQLIQVPSAANQEMAIVRAVVVTGRGTFEALGDASPINVDVRVVGHVLRVAETRAKARALRDAVNIGVAAFDELDYCDMLEPTALSDLTPVASSPANENQAGSLVSKRDDLMTAAQRRFLSALAADRGVAATEVDSWLEMQLDRKELSAWTKADASKMIERLRSTTSLTESVK